MISAADYQRRRRALLHHLGATGLAILPAAHATTRNRDVQHPFRQHSDFSYLTGFPEPDALAVLIPKRKEGEFVLFCQPRDPEREQWDGSALRY